MQRLTTGIDHPPHISELAFNSLFEMPPEGGGFSAPRQKGLSILYLRCDRKHDDYILQGVLSTFNSLFEMLKVNAGPLMDRISFNSLFEMRVRRKCPHGPRCGVFQFSI